MAQFNHYIEARIKGKLHGQETISVLHFGTNDPANDQAALIALLIQLAQAIIFCVINKLLGAVTQDWTFEGVDCKRLAPVLSDVIEVTAQAGSVGTRQQCNASFESIVIKKRSGIGGRRNRGRNFLPPPGDADMTQSVVVLGDAKNFYLDFLACLASSFIGNAASTNFRLLVLSKTTLKQFPGDYDNATVAVTGLELEPTVSTCRSRKVED